MELQDIVYEKSERVATVTYNRPEKMNAWTTRMFDELKSALDDADADSNIGAIIITGAGRAYCAGADMGGLSRAAQGTERIGGLSKPAPGTENLDPNYRGRFSWMLSIKKSIIGAIRSGWVSPTRSIAICGSRRTVRAWV
jgi:enoyl-CoA hydratase/carnithine racemase